MRIFTISFGTQIFALVLVLLLGMSASAVEVDTIYTVNIPVVGQSAAERAKAFRLAMLTELVRISGNREITTHPDADAIISQASRFVRQYIYTSLDKASLAEITVPRVKTVDDKQTSRVIEAPTQLLRIEFDGRALEKQLNEKNLPVWGKNRPVTLVWLAVQESNRSYILGTSDPHPLKELVLRAAMDRGIPLIFPLQDLEDQQNLPVADIRLGFGDSVQKASSRYGAEMILVGLLTQRGQDRWSADWSVYRQSVSTGWQLESSADEVIFTGIDNAADILASRYAMSVSGNIQRTMITVQVENIYSISDYASVQNYLESLTPVDAAKPRTINNNTVFYDVIMRGGRTDLERAIALQTLLKSVSPALSYSGSNSVATPEQSLLPLHYQLTFPKREQ